MSSEDELDEKLAAMIDAGAVQSLLDEFSSLTGLVTAILDLEGNIVVASGWQEVCTDFHRAHPETAKKCRESDVGSADGLAKGEYRAYQCKNHLWDVVAPLVIDGRTVGRVYTGQFFLEEEAPDLEVFAAQADEYGFDKEKYLAAVSRVPRYSRERIDALMRFLMRLTSVVAQLGVAGRRLAESERHLRNVLDHSADVVIVHDRVGNVVDCNEQACVALGYDREDLLRLSIGEIEAGLDEEALAGAWRDLEAGVAQTHEGLGRRKDGSTFPVEIRTGLLESADTQLVVATVRDLTERVRASEEMRERDQQLRQSQKMEALGQLAGGIAHDFNNLLTAITGYSDLIAASVAGQGTSVEEDIAEVRKAAERAGALTKQILAFSRRQQLRPTTASLNTVITELTPLLRRTLGADVELVTHLDEELGQCEIDVHQFEQVLVNLALNGRDAMSAGGRLTVETANVELGEYYARSHIRVKPGPHVMLAVSDTGVGMDAETASRVFEPFFTTKAAGKGTGLGLSTVFGIVTQSGGDIFVYSEVGTGTTFKVYLPRTGVMEEPRGSGIVPDSAAADGRTILVVDDEAAVAAFASRTLSDLGYKVRVAGDAWSALDILSVDPSVALLVTDAVLPGKEQGRDLVDASKALRPELLVLFMSGYTHTVAMDAGLMDQATGYLEKPFTGERLAQAVREALGPTER